MMPTTDHQFSLNEYLQSVKDVVNTTFAQPVWVRAEVRAVSSKGGHYYFELAEEGDDNSVIASCRATLWRYHASKVLSRFKTQTGTDIQAGTTLLLQGVASFHVQYGFSFNIQDIDPNFTLGALAQTYHAMIKRLENEGLNELNAKLSVPFDLRHVIVISPQNAAGLGDFQAEADRLAQAKACQFYYHHATFQGNHAPQEIREAINHAMQTFRQTHERLPDLLVIIRGGGAVGDLAYLNDYELACLVAEQPVPVWVGIGHEKDSVVLDYVAHTRFDTPSKVIHGIQNHLRHTAELAKEAMAQIRLLSEKRLTLAKQNTLAEFRHLKTTAQHNINQYQNKLHALISQTQKHALSGVHAQKRLVEHELDRHRHLKPKLSALAQECRHLQSVVLLSHPKRTLQKGYTLIHRQDEHIRSASTLHAGDTVHISFEDGVRSAVIL